MQNQASGNFILVWKSRIGRKAGTHRVVSGVCELRLTGKGKNDADARKTDASCFRVGAVLLSSG